MLQGSVAARPLVAAARRGSRCGLAFGVGLLDFARRRPRSRRSRGATRLARELVQATLRPPGVAVPKTRQAKLARPARRARRLRHVHVTLDGERRRRSRATSSRAPHWFSALVLPNARVNAIRIPSRAGRCDRSSPPIPPDEIAEIWQEIVWLAIGGAGVARRRLSRSSRSPCRARYGRSRRSPNALQRLEQRRYIPCASPADGLAGIRHHRRTDQRARSDAATTRRGKSPARARA